jgi:hypothetical protein
MEILPEKLILHTNWKVAEFFQIFRPLWPESFQKSGNSDRHGIILARGQKSSCDHSYCAHKNVVSCHYKKILKLDMKTQLKMFKNEYYNMWKF